MERIEVKNLTISRGNKRICNDASFVMQANSIVGFMGANGAGKTTLLRVLLGVIEPDKGVIFVDGKQRRGFDEEKTGIIHQYDNLSDYLTVKQYMKLEQKLVRGDKNYCKYLEERLKLTEWMNKEIGKLSYGTKRKLSIWKALIRKPELLVMDEPTNGLDEAMKEQVWELLKDLQRSGIIALVATNSDEEASRICDRIFYIEKQKLVEKTRKE
ncbi:ATP-binding cassette domain-containing protein [Clostridium sp. KNHs205]|jgi:ABC-2 type transport system ATP-binding protein|uniref:ABC transporter ATP-binding protein n=1 Tax=Clostridium sp. KNHs205 TaxID=1449050 RepID=UPI00051BE0E6|nr:ATP-binding cassette domain-containing protein [Clostridium sp. KNHs205]